MTKTDKNIRAYMEIIEFFLDGNVGYLIEARDAAKLLSQEFQYYTVNDIADDYDLSVKEAKKMITDVNPEAFD